MRFFKQSIVYSLLILTLTLLIGCHADSKRDTSYSNASAANMTIVNVVVDRHQFSTLATAVTEAQLVDALQASGPYTLFAPTNDAFNQLPDGVLAKLLKPENRHVLQEILKYHVVRGDFPAEKVVNSKMLPTLEGQPLTVRVDNNDVFVDDAKVTQTNLNAGNGVVHQIDKVLLPHGLDLGTLK